MKKIFLSLVCLLLLSMSSFARTYYTSDFESVYLTGITYTHVMGVANIPFTQENLEKGTSLGGQIGWTTPALPMSPGLTFFVEQNHITYPVKNSNDEKIAKKYSFGVMLPVSMRGEEYDPEALIDLSYLFGGKTGMTFIENKGRIHNDLFVGLRLSLLKHLNFEVIQSLGVDYWEWALHTNTLAQFKFIL